jgi:outer membrane protein assembly factor BamB
VADLNSSWIYIGIGGHVVAVDRATGTEMWRTRLRTGAVVNLAGDDRSLFASAQGELYCLDPMTGTVLWKNQLRRLGIGLVSLLLPGGTSGPLISLMPSRGAAGGGRSVPR